MANEKGNGEGGSKPATPAKRPSSPDRQYAVLEPAEDGKSFTKVGAFREADNPKQARREAAKEHLSKERLTKGVELVAIPARFFTSGKATVKVETKETFVDG